MANTKTTRARTGTGGTARARAKATAGGTAQARAKATAGGRAHARAKARTTAARAAISAKGGGYDGEYEAGLEPRLLTVGKHRYLAVDGRGAPASPSFQEAVGALYGAAWTVKMTRRQAGGGDFKVGALEGLWTMPGADKGPALTAPPETWTWKVLIRVPDDVGAAELRAAVAALAAKGRGAGAERVHIEDIAEGRCIQALHVGPYAKEPETVARMTEAAHAAGFVFRGPHHEIYMGDPRRTAPARLKTILRHPLASAGG